MINQKMTKPEQKNQDFRIDEKKAKKVAKKIDNLVKEMQSPKYEFTTKYAKYLIWANLLPEDDSVFNTLKKRHCKVDVTPQEIDCYLSHGYTSEKLRPKIISILESLEEILPRHELIVLRCRILSDSKEDIKEKIGLLLKLVEDGVHTGWATRRLGDLYAKLGDLDNSIKYYEKHLEDHKDIEVNYLVAEQYLDKGKIEDALKYYKKAIELWYELQDPDYINECYSAFTRIFYIHLNAYKQKRDGKYLSYAYHCIREWYTFFFDYVGGCFDDSMKVDEYEMYISKLEKLTEAALTQDKQKIEQALQNMGTDHLNILRKLDEMHQDMNRGFSSLLSEISSIKRQNISIDEKIDKLDRQILQKYEKKDYPEIESKLKQELSFWDKLEPNSKRFMTTAEFLLKDMKEGEFDFSVINLEHAKIMETELNNKLILRLLEEPQEDRDKFLNLDAKKNKKGEIITDNNGKTIYWSPVSYLLIGKYNHLMLGQISKVIEGILGYPNAPKNQFLVKFFEEHMKSWDFVENDLYNFPTRMAEIYRNGSVHMECKEKTVAENCRKETIEFLAKFYENLKSK